LYVGRGDSHELPIHYFFVVAVDFVFRGVCRKRAQRGEGPAGAPPLRGVFVWSFFGGYFGFFLAILSTDFAVYPQNTAI